MEKPLALELVKTVYTKQQMETFASPQVAVAGRSNVGKSSVINMLAGRKQMAKISSKPGKTRSLNFYFQKENGFYLVDLPGYGYARCSKKERQKWAELIEQYIAGNKYLKGVVVLLDCRLTPQELDLGLVSYLRSISIPILPVLTKADKCNVRQRSSTQKTWQSILDRSSPPLCVSSRTGMNRSKLVDGIIGLARGEPS
ncbi:MAG: ribosome biogenesis GTP-binding protein YihA/YsxC [Desulfovibrionales bacterium]